MTEMCSSNGTSTSTKNTTTSRGACNDFVRKLFNILESEKYTDIISWTKDGKNFVVLDTNSFTTKILPNHFKHSNFASFVRQLNKYDFHKVKRSAEEKQNSEYGEHGWEFNHPHFRIHDEVSLDNIKRKTIAQKKVLLDEGSLLRQKNSDSNLLTEVESPSNKFPINAITKAHFFQLKKKIDSLEELVIQLKNDNFQMKSELHKLSINYNTTVETFTTFKAFSDSLVSSFNLLSSTLSQQGIKVPPDITFNNNLILKTAFPMSSHSLQSTNTSNNNLEDNNSQTLRQGFHILLVEDDSICIQLCSKFLRKYGCTVEVVPDGLSAISNLEKYRYDLVLMDIVMPKLDGATATSIVRSFDNKTPIIAMTGNIDDQDLITYLQHGMNDILAKPFTKEDLHSMLIRYLKDKIPLSEKGSQGVPELDDASISPGGSNIINAEPSLKKQRI